MKRSYLCRIWHYCYSVMSLRQQVYRIITVFMSYTAFYSSKSSSLYKTYAAYGINKTCTKCISMPYAAFLNNVYARKGILNNYLCHYEYLMKLIMPYTAF